VLRCVVCVTNEHGVCCCTLQATEAAAAAASAEQQQQQDADLQQRQQRSGSVSDSGQGGAAYGNVINLDSHLAAKAGRPAGGLGAGRKAGAADDDWGEEPLGDDLLPM
jgi:hypothetical protein